MPHSPQHAPGPDRPRRILARAWQLLVRPSARIGAGFLLLSGLVAGAVAWQGFNTVVAYTNTLEFCTSCHEMKAYVYPDYAESPHYSNASGVRTTCADCHVPRQMGAKMHTKVRATVVELPRHLLQRIATEERFLAHKDELAERVWARMQANDSRECRECHSWQAMSEADQPLRAWREHVEAQRRGETCIECHKGIAHSLPPGFLEAEEEELEFDFANF